MMQLVRGLTTFSSRSHSSGLDPEVTSTGSARTILTFSSTDEGRPSKYMVRHRERCVARSSSKLGRDQSLTRHRRGEASPRGQKHPNICCFGARRHPRPRQMGVGLSQEELDLLAVTEEDLDTPWSLGESSAGSKSEESVATSLSCEQQNNVLVPSSADSQDSGRQRGMRLTMRL
mmetsp:Transcript_12461/g.29360  ORF Transcript_12461/g.29360 Transcript_12461/m.29360 type:complete len:175 (+) Transcript_12461:16-540(+)